MPQSKEPFRDPSEPLFEARINELEKGEGVGEVTTAKIGAEQVTAAKIAKETITPAKTETAFYPKRLICDYSATIKENTEISTEEPYCFTQVGGAPILSVTKKVKFPEATPPAFIIYNDPITVTGKSNKVELYAEVWVSKAPVASFTFSIFELTAFEEVAKEIVAVIATAGLGTIKITTPAAKSGANATGGAVALTGSGNYLVGVTISAKTAAESLVFARCKVYASNV